MMGIVQCCMTKSTGSSSTPKMGLYHYMYMYIIHLSVHCLSQGITENQLDSLPCIKNKKTPGIVHHTYMYMYGFSKQQELD